MTVKIEHDIKIAGAPTTPRFVHYKKYVRTVINEVYYTNKLLFWWLDFRSSVRLICTRTGGGC
jgi:hypothetical protein